MLSASLKLGYSKYRYSKALKSALMNHQVSLKDTSRVIKQNLLRIHFSSDLGLSLLE